MERHLNGRKKAFVMKLQLDPHQPFLDQHRPGGHPLFGTVMAIELMANTALTLSRRTHVAGIKDVRILAPLIFSDERSRPVEVRAIDGSNGWFDCEVSSVAPNGENALHFAGSVLSGTIHSGLTGLERLPELSGSREVGGEDIYRLFFHGPCFRVLQSIQWTGNAAVGRLARSLPAALSPPETSTITAPRLIELCLQTAGLLELADTGRMMIPARIGRIERLSDLDVNSSKQLLAVASRQSHDASAVDAQVLDEQGQVYLRVQAYRTVPLPFPADEEAIAVLRKKMLS